MTETGRIDLIRAAAESIAATQRKAGPVETLLGATDDGRALSDAAAFAVSGVLDALYPTEAEALRHAEQAFNGFDCLTAAVTDVAFAVGLRYGVLVATAER